MTDSRFFEYFSGTPQGDLLEGSQSSDFIRAFAGDDEVSARDEIDVVWAGDGDDTVDGGSNSDFLFGGLGSDTVSGGSGDDAIYGGSGDDVLIGIESVDVAAGRYGQRDVDKLVGGRGKDTFVLGGNGRKYYDDGDNTTDGLFDYALIKDFEADGTDTIQLSGLLSDYVLESLDESSPQSVGIFAVTNTTAPPPSDEPVLPIGPPLIPVFPTFSLGATNSISQASADSSTKELIGIIEGVDIASLSLSDSGQFSFVA